MKQADFMESESKNYKTMNFEKIISFKIYMKNVNELLIMTIELKRVRKVVVET